MEILKEDITNGILSMRFHADPQELAETLRVISQSQFSPQATPDESLYSEAALLLAQQQLVSFDTLLADAPDILVESMTEAQGMTFLLTVPVYPEVHLGQYLGIHTPYQEDPEAQQEAILTAAMNAMQALVPEALLLRKQQSLERLDREFLAQDPYYALLSDVLAILESSCRALGVSRPPQHSFADAADIMIRFMSLKDEKQTVDAFCLLIKENLLRLCPLPSAFDEELDRIIDLQRQTARKQIAEERTEILLDVYLRSRNLSKRAWHEETLARAEYLIRLDLLLNAVAIAEKLTITKEELSAASAEKPELPPEALSWMLLQEKARKLILDSAVIVH